MDWRPGQDLRLSLGDALIEARCWGSAPCDAPTLVLLHEGLGSVSLWRDFPDRLAQRTGFGVVAYSRRGYGRSSPVVLPRPARYMHDEALQVLPRLMDLMGVRRTVLFGHSDGASIAAIHAGLVADPRVTGLILLAPHFFVEDMTIAAIDAARVAFANSNLRARLARYHDDPDGAFLGWNRAWLSPDFRRWNITDCLAGINVPVLCVQGADDEYGSAAQLDCLTRTLPHTSTAHLLESCRHAPHLERPEQVLALTQDFLATLVPGMVHP